MVTLSDIPAKNFRGEVRQKAGVGRGEIVRAGARDRFFYTADSFRTTSHGQIGDFAARALQNKTSLGNSLF